MKKILVFALALALAMGIAGCTSSPETKSAAGAEVAASWTVPDGEVILLDNFEDGNFWSAVGDSWDQWGAHNWSLDADITEEWKSEGSSAAVWEWDVNLGPPSNQATFFSDQLLETDWTGVKAVVVDINNIGDASFDVQFCAQTTDGWLWSQTANETIPPGVYTVVFDLTKDLLDGSNMEIDAIPGMDEMKRAMFTVTLSEGPTKMLADNIRLIK